MMPNGGAVLRPFMMGDGVHGAWEASDAPPLATYPLRCTLDPRKGQSFLESYDLGSGVLGKLGGRSRFCCWICIFMSFTCILGPCIYLCIMSYEGLHFGIDIFISRPFAVAFVLPRCLHSLAKRARLHDMMKFVLLSMFNLQPQVLHLVRQWHGQWQLDRVRLKMVGELKATIP